MDNPLVVLRRALPGEPSLREFAKQIGVSHETLRKFESGTVMLSPDSLVAYSKAVKTTPAEVSTRFLRVRLAYHDSQAREARTMLSRMGVHGKRSGRPSGRS